MNHPRILKIKQNIQTLSISPVTKQIIITLQHFCQTMPTQQIKNFIKTSEDFNRLVRMQQEKLIHYYFLKLLEKVIELPLNQVQKLSLLKVTSATVLETTLNIPIQTYQIIITQICNIMLSTSKYDYILVIIYIVQRVQKYNDYYFNLLQIPKLVQSLIKIPPQYQVVMSHFLYFFIQKDNLQSNINKIVIQKNLFWLQKTLYNVLNCSRLIMKSIQQQSQCLDPYNMYTVWSDIYQQMRDQNQNRQIIFRQGIEALRFNQIVLLFYSLEIDINMKQITLMNIKQYPIPHNQDVMTIAYIICGLARSNKYFQAYDTQTYYQDQIRLKYEPSWIYIDDFVENIITQRLDTKNQKRNYYCLAIIQQLLALSFNYSQESYAGFCQYLFDRGFIEKICTIFVQQVDISPFLNTSIQRTFEFLLYLQPIHVCHQLSLIKHRPFFTKLTKAHTLIQCIKVLTLLNAIIYSYNTQTIYEKRQGFPNFIVKGFIQKLFVFSQSFDYSYLFVGGSIMPETIQNTTFLISVLLIADTQKVFYDWLKFINRQEILEERAKQFFIKHIDFSIASRFNKWLKYFDNKGKERIQLQKTMRLKYFKLRPLVVQLIDIFT